MKRILPGLLAALAVMIAATLLAAVLGEALLRAQGFDPATAKGSPISAVTIAIILGLIVTAAAGVRPVLKPGLDFSVKKLLRLGIILVGIRLSLFDVLQLGAIGIPLVAVLIACAIALALLLSKRLGVSPKFGLLTAAATSICGVTAALATAPAVDADEREVAYAVANTTLFGMVAMLLYPFLAHAVFGARSEGAGIFLGTSIHDTSQVVGAALAYRQMFGDEVAFKAATVTKLTRNLFIVAVVPLMGWIAARRAAAHGPAVKPKVRELVPLFVLGFVLMSVVRTVGEMTLARSGAAFGILDAGSWSSITKLLGDTASGMLLATAMAAVGLSTSLATFRKLGLRPLWLGGIVALAVGAIGMALALIAAPLIRL